MTNMYSRSVKQWNPFVGCKHDCTYCVPSFKAQAKRQKQRCLACYSFGSHEHPERLQAGLPRTGEGEFVFTCANGDVAFCSTEYLARIVEVIKFRKGTRFLIQSKDPAAFTRLAWPDNVILGTTIETNKEEIAARCSKAPAPAERFTALKGIDHPHKMITLEPIMECDPEVLIDWVAQISPVMVWVGYNSKPKQVCLPEPPLIQVTHIMEEVRKLGVDVIPKLIRGAINV